MTPVYWLSLASSNICTTPIPPVRQCSMATARVQMYATLNLGCPKCGTLITKITSRQTGCRRQGTRGPVQFRSMFGKQPATSPISRNWYMKDRPEFHTDSILYYPPRLTSHPSKSQTKSSPDLHWTLNVRPRHCSQYADR